MRQRFNVTGSCNPKQHYMVRLDDRLEKIKEGYVNVAISNRMFEMCLLNLFSAEESRSDMYTRGESARPAFIKDGLGDRTIVEAVV